MEELNIKDLTPMMKHWFSVKEKYKNKYPNHLIAYRMGDFYEFFYDDAVRVSNLLGITLTKRKVGGDAYPLAGIPHHAGSYLKNLVNLGQTVVVVDQLEDPSTVKGRIVKRGVVRILSPGTVIETDMLKSNSNNYICSIVKEKKGFGIAFADLSTGEFVTTEFSIREQDALDKVLTIFSQYDPVEVIVPLELKSDDRFFLLLTDLNDALIKPYEDFVFTYDEAHELIKRHFNLSSVHGLGLEGKKFAIQASGGLLAFLKETQRDVLPNIFKISLIQEKGILHLDYITQRNLELTTSLWERGKDTTLFSIFSHTHTPMGTRLLKKIILQPLLDVDEINQRLNIVQKFKDDIFLRTELREQLNLMGDLERFVNRINYSGDSNARDLINIKNSLEIIPRIKNILKKASIPEIESFLHNIEEFIEIGSLINASIKQDPPTTVKEGNIIRDGFNEKVDELRDLVNNGKKYILEYEKQEKNKLNLTSGIKIGHNNILGYYIQITLNTLKGITKVPEEYNERQTLKNAKRYTTQKLKTLEEDIVEAEEQIFDLEYEIYTTIRQKVVKETKKILKTTKTIAYIDVLACFAEISENYNYCRPIVKNSQEIIIEEGRHPVIEQMNITEKFIPNNCYLDTEKEQILIITGPNMSGKSTYLRQVALICIIAQMGCFVPAKSAEIGIIDQIFTRIGASDDLARKLSTFMIEMTETAKILNYATPSSLIIIDELGRGTSTSDGQSIAMATIEKLHRLKAKTLFSTHYHQLTEINLPRIKNYHLDIIENEDGSINFVRTLKEGSTDKSYGIHVAKLAGIPDDVIIRAFEILDQIERKDPFKEAVKANGNGELNSKYYEKFINEKRNELQKLNNELRSKKHELIECEDELLKKEKELGKKEFELEKSQILMKQSNIENISEEIKDASGKRKKSYVQTTFFKPKVLEKLVVDDDLEEILYIIKNLDINSLTPINAMKVIINIKQKTEKVDFSNSKD